MSDTNIEQLKRQIEILKEVLVLRENGENDSPYVCDNITQQIGSYENDAEYAICKDINQYINSHFSVRSWMEQRDGCIYYNCDEKVEAERIKMIETLIARYEAALLEAA